MPKQIITEEEYKNAAEYLHKAGDLGREPMPFWILLIMSVIVLFVSFPFAKIMAGFAVPGLNEENQIIAGIAIGFMMLIIMVALFHAAGAQLYRTSLLRKCYKQIKLNKIEATAKFITLEDAQEADDKESKWLQTISRVAKYPDDKGSYSLLIIGIFFAVLICVSSTYMRQQALLKYINTNIDATQIDLSSSSPFPIFGLAFIFFTIYSIYVGYKYSFAGRQSKQAYKVVKQYKSQQ